MNFLVILILLVSFSSFALEKPYSAEKVSQLIIDKEIKSVEDLAPIHTAQILTYLKLKNLKLGLLVNFNSVKVIDGIKRVINGYL